MSNSELTLQDRIRERTDEMTVGQLAGLATGSAVTLGVLLALVGLALDLNRNEVIVLVSGLALVAFVGMSHAFFRAMFLGAKREEGGTPADAMTYPLFPALLVLVAIAVGIFISIYVYFNI